MTNVYLCVVKLVLVEKKVIKPNDTRINILIIRRNNYLKQYKTYI